MGMIIGRLSCYFGTIGSCIKVNCDSGECWVNTIG